MRRRLVLAGLITATAIAGWLVLGQYTRAVTLLVLAAGIDGWPRTVARLHERMVSERSLEIRTRDGLLRARAYSPEGRSRRTVVLIAGVHPEGIDDPRLMHFARSMAGSGLSVITPQVPRLIRFEITPSVTDTIEEVAAWAAAQESGAGDRRVGLAGISFSGGLAVVAAGRESLRDRVAFVLSIGGHGDLLRTLETLAGGVLASDVHLAAEPFGLAIVLSSVAERVVPPSQVAPLREWARTFLSAVHLPPEQSDLAQERFSRAAQLAGALDDPAATFVHHVRAADTAALRPHLIEPVREFAMHPSLSPERATPPAAPVYLLHGTEDEVIPPREALHLARYLQPHTHARVLLTPVLTHADVAQLELDDGRALVAFLGSLLRR